ncbi:3alpha-hydroxy bile acid-CoA-ester 3-dehydrogenase 2 [Zhongshania aliphaticivorans]|uniref:3alpha-hydroxy bile acid-CoA-ester 3-dehydrogenase 2 n=1 Tax=Zhongshania aliphaticivorans TaxID=1470434 RepID=A0A5S9N725_9GAMM|nr:oxidoreductase [Zhongshania aliphaticivorans]CAA0081729.1 3alpha-hydroxy bile acid-CoA-ester 3-dehydrogenase 2 [Zhongshania aliphaticivorans]CAA0084690.1 3alpha-hydroxy bile acid-CoA-ester 3-dehydrogenase 2 [Zhongshania aliphaticivorans]
MSTRFTADNVPDMSAKTVVITGANTGLGFETAKVLAGRGANVVIACRSQLKADKAMALIRETHRDAKLSSVALDLGSLASIKAAAKNINALPSLDILINNAGIMIPPYELTVDGFESQFGVNHLGPFALTGLLLDKLNTSPGGRIVNTSSLAANNGKFLFDDVNAELGYDAMKRYSMSKLTNGVFSKELDKRLKAAGSRCVSIACHPGIATTDLSRHFPWWVMLGAPFISLLCNSPAQGAWPTLMAATDVTLRGGEYCGPSKRQQMAGPAKLLSLASYDQVEADRLWAISVEMTGVNYLS